MARRLGVLGMLLSLNAFAEPDGIQLPQGTVDTYRVESQYGPEIAVLQPRYGHDNRLELGLGATYSSVSSVFRYAAAQGSVVYHINARHAIEPLWLSFAFFKQKTDFVKTQIADKISNKSALSVEIPQMTVAASYLYTPYYAKMHLTERTVTHFDVYFGLGFAMVKGQNVFLDDKLGDTKMRPGVSLAGGLRFLFDPRWALRLEVRDIIHQQDNFGAESLVNNIQLAASLNIFFGRFHD